MAGHGQPWLAMAGQGRQWLAMAGLYLDYFLMALHNLQLFGAIWALSGSISHALPIHTCYYRQLPEANSPTSEAGFGVCSDFSALVSS